MARETDSAILDGYDDAIAADADLDVDRLLGTGMLDRVGQGLA